MEASDGETTEAEALASKLESVRNGEALRDDRTVPLLPEAAGSVTAWRD